MRTLINSAIKRPALILIAAALVSWGCVNRQGNQDMEGKKDAEKAIAPGMDIFTAVITGNIKAVNGHIKAGTNLDQKDEFGSTPLIIASTFGKNDVALALINGGADVNLQSNEGSTPLHTAAFFCRTELVTALLKKGADRTIRNNYGSTPYETVVVPFATVKPIYDQISRDLGQFGLKIDYSRIEKTRPVIAEMLK